MYSQISIDVGNKPIKEILKQIERSSNYRFFYSENLKDLDKIASLTLSDASVEKTLDVLLKGTQISFNKQSSGIVLLFPKGTNPTADDNTKTKTVVGVVTDEKGESIIGASVVIKGTSNGFITDVNGKFSIDVPDDNTVLQVSYIGYITQNITAGSQRSLYVTLIENASELDEVVVIGYGTVRKKDLTGAVSVVKSRDITAVPVSNALEALQGKVPGLDLTKNSGEAGSEISFTLRGNRSLNASNAPLILIDGIQYGSMVDVNTSDIESIQVLKDASSTAIYGSRGANGVILITTRKGVVGKPVLSFNMYAGLQSNAGLAQIQTPQEWVDFRREAFRTKGITDDNSIFNGSELNFIQNGDFIEWQDICIRNGSVQNYELSVSGGTEISTFNYSLGLYDEKGLLKNDNLRRYNGSLSGNYKLGRNVKIGASIMYTFRDKNARQDPLNQANKIIPLGKVYDDNGQIILYPANNTSVSPIADEIDGNYKNNLIWKRMFSTIYLDWTILPKLVFLSTMGLDIQDSRTGIYYGRYTINGGGSYSQSSIVTSGITNLTWENTLTWNKAIQKHNFEMLLGQSMNSSRTETANGQGRNQVAPSMSFYNLGANISDKIIGSSKVENRMVSVFGRVNYRFNEKYLLTASLRADGASPLAKGHKWGAFPSAAVAWRIIDEDFMKSQSVFTDLKLRTSWGISGNSAISPYATLGALGASVYAFNESPAYGYFPNAISNEALKWEQTGTYNVAVDFGLIKNRISGSAELYLTNTKDLLMSRIIPATSGYANVMENVGKTRNKGFEITLNTINISSVAPERLQWRTDWSFYLNREEIVELINGVDQDLSNNWFVGSPISVYYDYEKIGIWQLDEETEAAKYGQEVGEIKVKDQNGDGVIDANHDRVIVGTPRPDFNFGMNNYLSFKNFDLTVFLFARAGQTIRSEASGNYKIDGVENGPKVDYWTPEHPTNSHPRPDNNKNSNAAYMSTLYFQDGSFLKIRDISLGYTVPKKFSSRFGIKNLRVYSTLKNYFTFSHMQPYDPERGGNLSFPMTTQWIFGLNLTF
jgi:TonB-linked SusC/RagA family outer membrane protein